MSAQTVHIIAWTIFGSAGLLFFWALFFDFARRILKKAPVRRCPKCWYDLTHTPGMTCSECGYVARHERKLHKSRKRKRWAALAIIMMIASHPVYYFTDIKQRGWVAAVPTTALIASLPTLNPRVDRLRSEFGLPAIDKTWWMQRSDDLFDELHARTKDDRLLGWQWRLLIARCMHGDRRREPTYHSWQSIYGELLKSAIAAGRLSYADALAYARSHLRVDQLRRSMWPEGETVSTTFIVDGWNPARGRTGVGFGGPKQFDPDREPNVDGLLLRSGIFVETGQMHWLQLFGFEWDEFDSCEPPLDFKIDVSWLPVFDPGEIQTNDGPIDTVIFSIERVPLSTMDRALHPVADPALDDAIRKHMKATLEFSRWNGSYNIDIDASELRAFSIDPGIPILGADLEVMVDDEVIHRDSLCLWAPPTDSIARIETERLSVLLSARVFPGSDDSARMFPGSDDPGGSKGDDVTARLRDAIDAGRSITLRITSNPAHALKVFCCDSYWQGEVTIPIVIAESAGENTGK